MARKLKTYVTSMGFYDLAVAAPSMKAAMEAWGLKHNVFHRGTAAETDDPAIVAAAMAKPGTVLRRPVGTREAFEQNAALPAGFTLPPVKGPLPKLKEPRKEKKKKPRAEKHRPADDKAERAKVISFEKARAARERARAKEEQAARREAEKRGHAVEKAEAALDQARKDHQARREKLTKSWIAALPKKRRAGRGSAASWKRRGTRRGEVERSRAALL